MIESGKVIRVLFVEDDPLHHELIKRGFEENHKVALTWCRTISEAVQTANEAHFDAMITDNRLPDGEGIALIEAFHDRMPVLLMTSFGSEELAVRSFKAGVVDYIVKSPEAFEQLPGRILRIKREWDNIAALKMAEDSLKTSEERYRLAVDGSNDILWDWDIEHYNFYISQRGVEQLGVQTDFADLLNILQPKDARALRNALQQHLNGHTPFLYCECETRLEDSGLHWLLVRGKAQLSEEGIPVRIAGSITNTSTRKEYEARIEHLAYADMVTGLPNRQSLVKDMQTLLEKNRDAQGALLFVDLDDFKLVNDTVGHTLGDQLLQAIAKRLEQTSGFDANIYRLGGDEFVALYTKPIIRQKLERIAERLIGIMNEKHDVETHSFRMSASIGIAVFPENGKSLEDLLKNADMAMYHAKKNGKNQYQFFTDEMNKELLSKLQMEKDLRLAIDSNQLLLYYQPILDLKTKLITGVEALVRWQKASGELIFPNDFIPLAEETLLINPMGLWVFRTACRMAKKLNTGKDQVINVTVNVSPIQLRGARLAEQFEEILAEEQVNPTWLGIELTESQMMLNYYDSTNNINKLRSLGLTILLDDFGTGFSSLNYLNQLPIDIVKIDRSFMDNLCTVESRRILTKAVILLAKDLGKVVIAEGVETCEQLQLLERYSCERAQGYWFARPMPENMFEQWQIDHERQRLL